MRALPAKQILAVDIGGSKLLTGIVAVSSEGKVSLSAKTRREIDRRYGKKEIFRELTDAIDETLATSGIEPNGIGVTIPGIADPVSGTWLYAPFSGIRDFPIAALLSQQYQKPVSAENDVNACAWGEYIFGVCSDIDDFLWITVSNGIGGGLVLGGKIFRGHFGCAAEIGHCKVRENGAHCGCGGHGCLEAEAAGPGISRRYAELTGQSCSAAEIAISARNGNSSAAAVYQETGRLLGKGAALAANIINPAAVVIGGGVAQSFDLFESEMKRVFAQEAMTFANKDVQILKTGLGYEAGLFAAASLLYR